MAIWRKLPKWIVPPPAGALAGWATAATAGAPAPATWTLVGIAAWCSVPFHWAFIVIGIIAGTGSFLGLRGWLDDKPIPPLATADDMERVRAELAALREELSSNPTVSNAVAEQFGTAAEELARSDDPEERAAAAKIAGGSPVAAADRLMEEMRAGKMRNSERAIRAARIYAPFAPSKAMDAYAEAVGLEPTNFEGWIELGRLRAQYESLESAEQCFRIALQQVRARINKSAIETELGQLALAAGDLGRARQYYEAALTVDESLAADEPDNHLLQHNLAISYAHLGRLAEQAGELDDARGRYEAALSVWKRLISEAAAASEYRWGVCSVSADLSDLDVSAGDLQRARHHLETARAILEELVAQEPGKTTWLRNLAVAHSKLGDVEYKLGHSDIARDRFHVSLNMRKQLAAMDPENAHWQRDLSTSYEQLGILEVRSGNLPAALNMFRDSIPIVEHLANKDPNNSTWQRDRFVSYANFALIKEKQGDSAEALRYLKSAETHIARLVDRLSDHPGFAQDLIQVRADIARLEENMKGGSPSALH